MYTEFPDLSLIYTSYVHRRFYTKKIKSIRKALEKTFDLTYKQTPQLINGKKKNGLWQHTCRHRCTSSEAITILRTGSRKKCSRNQWKKWERKECGNVNSTHWLYPYDYRSILNLERCYRSMCSRARSMTQFLHFSFTILTSNEKLELFSSFILFYEKKRRKINLYD